MGSDETAITIPGGPRVIDVFHGNGAPSGPNYTLFSGAGLVVGSRLYRIRRRCGGLVLPESLKANNGQKMAKPSGLLREIDQKS